MLGSSATGSAPAIRTASSATAAGNRQRIVRDRIRAPDLIGDGDDERRRERVRRRANRGRDDADRARRRAEVRRGDDDRDERRAVRAAGGDRGRRVARGRSAAVASAAAGPPSRATAAGAVREVSADVESAQRYSEAFHAANGTTGADQAADNPAG